MAFIKQVDVFISCSARDSVMHSFTYTWQ